MIDAPLNTPRENLSPAPKVCGILITWFPDTELPARAAQILQQVETLIVIDNASTGDSALTVAQLAHDKRIRLQINPENIGHASALNQGAALAQALGYVWALLLDQDSVLHPQTVECLGAILHAYPQPLQLAAIGAQFLDRSRYQEAFTAFDPDHVAWQTADWVITSGSLLSLAAWEQSGRFRDEFFIAAVDKEFGLRAARHGFLTVQSTQPLLKHTIGAPSLHRHFGRQTWTTHHSAERRYYSSRNNMVLLRESGRYPHGLWLLKGWLANLKLMRRILFLEDDSWNKWVAIVQGGRDAMLGRMGKRKGRR